MELGKAIMTKITPHYYQSDAIAAINNCLASRPGNPGCSIPTGGGKTIVFSLLAQEWIRQWPETRILILAHRKELLSQAADKLRRVWPNAPIGLFSAGLGRKDGNRQITIAGIQSIYRRACDLDPWHVVIVDEAHRIPFAGEGQYLQFLRDARLCNPMLKVICFTATPFRMKGGSIAGTDNICNYMAYEANIRELIDKGFLSPVVSKHAVSSVDVSGVTIRGGEFVQNQLNATVNQTRHVEAATAEAMRLAKDRKSLLFFCCSIKHAENVCKSLRKAGHDADVMHSKTPSGRRAELTNRFESGQLRILCSVDTISEGFDATRTDCIVMLRPTASPGLYMQQAGRGLRLHPGKADCLILDFAGNVERHGPLDLVGEFVKKGGKKKDGEAPVKTCPECQAHSPAGIRECPECGYQWPEPQIKHHTEASSAPILSNNGAREVKVDYVTVAEHEKEGSPLSLRVTYHAGNRSYSEWICLGHNGFAKRKASKWWLDRFGLPVPPSAEDALAGQLFLAQNLTVMTAAVFVRKNGKYHEIVDYTLDRSERSVVNA